MKWVKDETTYKKDHNQNAESGRLKLNVIRHKKSKSGNPWFYQVAIIGLGSVMGVASTEAKARAFAMKFGRLLIHIYGR